MARSFACLPLLCLAGALFAPAHASAQAPDSAAAVRGVLALEDGRFAAMVRADTAWLRDALADDLSYVHSSARSETKTQYLASVGSGTLRYQEFTPRERRVRLLGGRRRGGPGSRARRVRRPAGRPRRALRRRL